MAMVVKNNLGANSTLNKLNKNSKDVSKSSKKLSSGMKINDAGDDASGYSISERMRVKIRALGQDIQNVETGNNLIGVAEGAIQSITDNLRSMKEMLLNAMNDHNTDQDRETLQKEYDKRMELIEDIAAETSYNGKLLLNGDHESPDALKYHGVVQLPMDLDSNGALTVSLYNGMTTTLNPIEEVWPYRDTNLANRISSSTSTANTTSGGLVQNTTVRNLTGSFSAMPGTGTQGPLTKLGVTCQQTYNGTTSNRTQLKVDFSSAVNAIGAASVRDFHLQGFSILCDGCSQFINIRFDASIPNSSSTYNPSYSPTNGQAREYLIGIQDIANVSDLPKAFYDGVNASHANFTGTKQYGNTYPDRTNSLSLDDRHDLRIATDGNGNYWFDKQRGNSIGLYDASLDPTYTPGSAFHEPYRPGALIIHDGTQANQHMKVYINDMGLDALKLVGTGTTPRDYAALSLGYVDYAINYALNEATRMGAYRSRLDMTESNLVTGSENTQGAESTIRDADMAKEMTEYTKNNVLLQAAQSMLAQANQNSSSVLSLLQ